MERSGTSPEAAGSGFPPHITSVHEASGGCSRGDYPQVKGLRRGSCQTPRPGRSAGRADIGHGKTLRLSANFCKFAGRWSALPPEREESPDRTGQPAAESADRGNLVWGVTENNSRKAMVKTRGKSSRRAAAMSSGYAAGSCKTKYTDR